MPPTPDEMTFTPTASVDSFVSALATASTEPCTSALRTTFTSLTSPALDLVEDVLERDAAAARQLLLAARVVPVLDQRLGRLLVVDDVEDLARVGDAVEAQDLDRRRRAGLGDGLPLVAQHGADLPENSPATTRSPERSVPSSTRIVEIGPRARSRRASTTCPLAGLFGLALSSSTSACSASISSSLSIALLGLRRHVHEDRVAAPLFGDEAVLRELVADQRRGWRPACRSC